MGDGGHRVPKQPTSAAQPLDMNDTGWLRDILHLVPAFVVRVDSELRIRYTNKVPQELHVADVIGQPATLFIAEEYRGQVVEASRQLQETGEPQALVVKGLGPFGSLATYQTTLSLTSDGSGDIVAVVFDVTEHIERAEKLRASEEQLRVAIEATGLGLWSWNRETGEVAWNDRLHEITGRDVPVPPDDWVKELVAPEDAERVTNESAEPANPLPHRIVRPDGTARWVLRIGQSTASDVVVVRGALLDVTAQHDLEERLKVAERRQAVGVLTAGLAHNFNNMLAVIRPSIELALRSADASEQAVLENALHATDAASELVGQLMTYAGQRSTEKRTCSIRQVVDSAARMCRETLAGGIELEIKRCEKLFTRGNLADLERLLFSLLINARDAVAEVPRPRIEIDVEAVEARDPSQPDDARAKFIRIRICDNGVGMDEATLRRAFEPFFSSKGPALGTGLGLATSQAIAAEHGGWISFESTPGVGCCASVFLRHLDGELDQAAEVPTTAATRSLRVLVVEDEPAVRDIVVAVLEDLGHSARGVDTASHAVELLEAAESPQVVLLDRSMPGWPAARAVKEIRKRVEDAKVLFFTGQSVPQEERDLVDGVVYKPVSIEDLEQAILGCVAD